MKLYEKGLSLKDNIMCWVWAILTAIACVIVVNAVINTIYWYPLEQIQQKHTQQQEQP